MKVADHSSNTFRPRLYSDSKGDYWKEASCEDGIYYYNTRTRETTWDIPEGLREIGFVDSQPVANAYDNKVNSLVGSDYGYGREDENESNTIMQSKPIFGTDWVSHELKNGQTYYSNCKTNQTTWDEPEEVKSNKKFSVPQTVDNNLPIAAEPIFGSSWYLVMTGKGDFFYYNHINRKSTWHKPEELHESLALESVMQSLDQQKKGLKHFHSAIDLSSLRRTTKCEPSVIEPCSHEHESPKNIEDNVVDAINTEDNIKQERLSYADRLKEFHKLLDEKKVSAFSTYESELAKLEKDPRFLLFSNKDRKALFNEYILSGLEDEKQRKIDELKEKHLKFKEFLKQVVKSSKASYTDILMRYSSDPRFKIVPKEREREHLFQEYMIELNKSLNSKDNDANECEDGNKNEIFSMFAQLPQVDVQTPWRRVKRLILEDPRFLKLNDEAACERFYDEYIEKKVDKEKLLALERSKIEQEKKSISDRQRYAQSEKARNLDAVDREKRTMIRSQSMETFKNMLTISIKDSHYSWHEAKRILRDHDLWQECCDALNRDEMFELFDSHMDELRQKDIDAFYDLLHEAGCDMNSRWDEVYPTIKIDHRCRTYSKNEKSCRNRFYTYQEDLRKKATKELKELLLETKLVDGRFLSKAKLMPSLYDDLYKILQTDHRYTIFDHFDKERKKIIDDFLLELQNQSLKPDVKFKSKSCKIASKIRLQPLINKRMYHLLIWSYIFIPDLRFSDDGSVLTIKPFDTKDHSIIYSS